MREVMKWETPQDLAMSSFETAILDLGASTHEWEVNLTFSDGNWPIGHEIALKWRCGVNVVPAEMLATPETWGVTWHGRTVWSEGIR